MPEMSDVTGNENKSYSEIAFGAEDPWNPSVITRLVRLVKDDGSETYSVFINENSDGRLIPSTKVKKGVSGTIDVLIIANGNTVKYFLDGKYVGKKLFTVNTPSEGNDIGFYCVGGSGEDPITLHVDDTEIAIYNRVTDTYGNVDDDDISYSFYTDTSFRITFSGYMKKEKIGTEVIATIKDSSETPIGISESYIGKDGQFEIVVPLSQSTSSGTYSYTLDLDNGKKISNTFSMFDYSDAETVYNNTKNSTTKANNITILDNGGNLCLGKKVLEDIYPTINKGFMAEKLIELKNSGDFPTSLSDFIDKLQEYTILCALSEDTKIKEIINNYSDVFGVSAECFDYYSNNLNAVGVSNVVKNMHKAFEKYSDVEEAFRHLVYTNYITNNKNIGANNTDEIVNDSLNKLGFNITNKSPSIIRALATSNATNPLELKAAYETAIAAPSENDTKTVGGFGGGGGGSINSSDTVYVPLNSTIDVTNSPSRYFSDISGYSWAAEAIDYLRKNNIVFGKSDNEFYPQDNIVREEAIAMISRIFNFSQNEDSSLNYGDVDKEAWYYSQIKAAFDNNIVSGLSSNTIGIGKKITRQDFLTILLRAVITESSIDVYVDQNEKAFADYESISDYAKEAVNLFSTLKVISGYEDGTFRPNNTITRAEAAQMLYQVCKLKEGM